MKKLLVVLFAAALLVSFSSNDLFARGIGIKGGYTWMQDDNSDVYDNN